MSALRKVRRGDGRAGQAAETPTLIAAIDLQRADRGPVAARLIDLAADAGAGAVKFSMHRRAEAGLPDEPEPPRNGHSTSGRTRTSAHKGRLTPDELRALRRQARARNLGFILAPRDEDDVAVAQRVAPDRYQIDPPALGNRELLSLIARSGRPAIVVAGMCTERELGAALQLLKGSEVAILHAVMAPVLAPAQMRLGMIPHLQKRFGRPVGYLSLEAGTRWSLVAAALGAGTIEKPFTIDRSLAGALPGAIGPEELRQLSSDLGVLTAARQAPSSRIVFPEELDLLESTQYSLVATRRLRKGALLTDDDVTLEAPVRGLSSRLAEWARGRRLLYDLEPGEPITFGVLEIS